MAYKVLIADNQKMVRQMFELAVKSSENYEIAAFAAAPEEAVEKALHQKIDLILMNVVMGSGMDGLDAAKEIKEKRPEIKILLVTSMPEVVITYSTTYNSIHNAFFILQECSLIVISPFYNIFVSAA